MSKKVFISSGHGYEISTGKGDPGACGNGLKEADLTLKVSLACRDELLRHGIQVGVSKETQTIDPVNDEVKKCNAYNPDLALDIHFNSASNNTAIGSEVLVYSGGGKSKELGQAIQNRLVKDGGRVDRGIKTRLGDDGKDYFGFIRMVNAPSIIVEVEFISNPVAIKEFNTTETNVKFGKIIAHGILDCLGVSIKPESNNTPVTKNITVTDTTVHFGDKTVNGMIHNGTTMVGARDICNILGLGIDFRDGKVYISK